MGKIKIYKAFHAYQSYLDYLYNKNQELKVSTFIEQRHKLIYDGSPWIFSWSTNNIDENIEIFETVHNCEYLQKAWSAKFKDDIDWQINIVFEQIRDMQPDICVLYPPQLFDEEKINNIRNLVHHDLLIIGYDGMDRKNIKLYQAYDLIITCSKYISEYYVLNNKLTYTLNFGFDEQILNRINTNKKVKYDIGFSGSIYQNVHDGRYELLRNFTKKNKVAIRSDFAQDIDLSLFSKNQLKRLIKQKDIQNYFGLWRVDKSNFGPLYGLEMYQFLRDSKVSLNMHGDKIAFAANVRLYEITGVGSCLLTDWKENIAEIFDVDKEVVTYQCVEEAIDKSKFLIKHDNIRQKIALAGQYKTLSEYTYKKTIPTLMNFLKSLI